MLHLRLAGAEFEVGQDVGPAGHAAARQAAGQDLGQRRQVGPDAVMFLRPAGRDAEAGDDLVEDQQPIRGGP